MRLYRSLEKSMAKNRKKGGIEPNALAEGEGMPPSDSGSDVINTLI